MSIRTTTSLATLPICPGLVDPWHQIEAPFIHYRPQCWVYITSWWVECLAPHAASKTPHEYGPVAVEMGGAPPICNMYVQYWNGCWASMPCWTSQVITMHPPTQVLFCYSVIYSVMSCCSYLGTQLDFHILEAGVSKLICFIPTSCLGRLQPHIWSPLEYPRVSKAQLPPLLIFTLAVRPFQGFQDAIARHR